MGVMAAQPAMAGARTAPVSLQWQVSRPTHLADTTLVSPVTLVITNISKHNVANNHWSIWLNSMSGVEADPSDPQVGVEHFNGSLFVLRPKKLLHPLNPGQHWIVHLYQPDEHVSIDKAIQGPYLVFEDSHEALPILTTSVEFTTIDYRSSTPLTQARFNRNSPDQSDDVVLPTPARVSVDHTQPTITVGLTVAAQSPMGTEIRSVLNATHATNRRLPQCPVRLIQNKQLHPEAYVLRYEPETGVSIEASDDSGWFYGLQTLRLWLYAHADPRRGGVTLGPFTIEDEPRFAYRGLMIDVARNFESVAAIERVIDWMALLKLNRLHLHLSDDEGWRVEIPGLPELTSKGACRAHFGECLPPAYGSGPFKSNPRGSGYYRVSDYKTILRYAKMHHVIVIPEIEMPGHAYAAIVAMQSTSAFQLDIPTPADATLPQSTDSAQGYRRNAINPLLPSTYRFVDKVVSELAAIHAKVGMPLSHLHIGGDELAETAWQHLSASTSTDAAANRRTLWESFYDHINSILTSHGIESMAWEDLGIVPLSKPYHINQHFINTPVVLEIWNTLEGGEGLGHQLANAGYDIVMAPANHYYLDIVQSDTPLAHGHNWSGVTNLHKTWSYDPTESNASIPPLTAAGRGHILGVEATLFSETLSNDKRMGEMLFPRLLGVAERAWSQTPQWSQVADDTRARRQDDDWQRFQSKTYRLILPYIHSQYPTVGTDFH
jgi:hexosaminidase